MVKPNVEVSNFVIFSFNNLKLHLNITAKFLLKIHCEQQTCFNILIIKLNVDSISHCVYF